MWEAPVSSRLLDLCRRHRAGGRSGAERGAALVEFVLLLPLLMLITFGLIEYSSAYQSSSAATAAARTAARTASAEAMLTTFAIDASAAAATSLRTLPSTEPVEMWVYRANAQGLPESGGFATCAAHCIKYTWNAQTRAFNTGTPSGDGWPANTQNACNSANWDTVGVYVKLDHKFLTKLFVPSITLTDHALFRLEPAPTQLCP
jgi:Flp pilus assembly protein TadG